MEQISNPRRKKEKKKHIFKTNEDIFINKNILKKGYSKKKDKLNVFSKSNLLSVNT